MILCYSNKKIIRLISYSLITVLLFFISLEVIQRVRYFLRFHSSYWLLYGFTNKPSNYDIMQEKGLEAVRRGVKNVEIRTVYFEGYRKYNPRYKTVGTKINSFGLRGKEFDREKKEGVFRIILVGGSTTFGLGTEDGFTYPEFLEEIVNSNPDRHKVPYYEVINAGICAAEINEIHNLFRSELISLKPDMVIVNSLFNNLYYSKNTHMFNRWQKINQTILDKSLFYMTLREKINYLLKKPVGELYKVPLQDMLRNFIEDKEFYTKLNNDFKYFIKMVKDNNIQAAIIKQPVWLRNNKKDRCGILLDKKFSPVWEKVYFLLDNIAREEDVGIIDAASYFNMFPEKEKFFIDGLHLTKEGNRYLASLVADWIKNNSDPKSYQTKITN